MYNRGISRSLHVACALVCEFEKNPSEKRPRCCAARVYDKPRPHLAADVGALLSESHSEESPRTQFRNFSGLTLSARGSFG